MVLTGHYLLYTQDVIDDEAFRDFVEMTELCMRAIAQDGKGIVIQTGGISECCDTLADLKVFGERWLLYRLKMYPARCRVSARDLEKVR